MDPLRKQDRVKTQTEICFGVHGQKSTRDLERNGREKFVQCSNRWIFPDNRPRVKNISFLHPYLENFWIPAVVAKDVVVAR